MGEAQRRIDGGGFQMKPLRPGEQVQVDMKNAVPKLCGCGCSYFTPAIMVFTISPRITDRAGIGGATARADLHGL